MSDGCTKKFKWPKSIVISTAVEKSLNQILITRLKDLSISLRYSRDDDFFEEYVNGTCFRIF
ncbi:hypothetical protein SAMN04488511_12112 [Pedobacter suwonensis]|uniref:Uncharacterized protein n=1 Tax=Pedobacter suwonensis TaxID=332999 RepID=A0A1I0U586_9SPHI|nr:hypothetical protein SAMN04488511_12112 [Pedobacter suwonensis]